MSYEDEIIEKVITCECGYEYVLETDMLGMPFKDLVVCKCGEVLFTNVTEYRDKYFNKA